MISKVSPRDLSSDENSCYDVACKEEDERQSCAKQRRFEQSANVHKGMIDCFGSMVVMLIINDSR